MRWFLLLAMAACDPGFQVDVTVDTPLAAAGHPVIVLAYYSARYDGSGLPVGQPMLVAARPVVETACSSCSSSSIAITYGDLGCATALYMAAWVDLHGNVDLAGRTYSDADYQSDAARALEARQPVAGDLVGVGGPLAFGPAGVGCKNWHQTLAISVAP